MIDSITEYILEQNNNNKNERIQFKTQMRNIMNHARGFPGAN